MLKCQIWITKVEGELLCDSLDFLCSQLNQGSFAAGDAHKVAGRYVYRRAKELNARIRKGIDVLDAKESAP